MTDTASSSSSSQNLPEGDLRRPAPEGADVGGREPVADTQPTVISRRPPLGPPAEAQSAPPDTPEALQPGSSLGEYELLQYVGGGGMGRVYRALDRRLSRVVALKVLPPDQAADRETRLRFQNEARTAAQLDHESFARVHYVGDAGNMPYLVFEYIEGTDIRAIVKQRGPLALADAVSYTLQVADALTHAADRGIVHRDVKPSNILVTPEGRAKVIDLGLARLQQPQRGDDDLTASGVTLGTFDYISPEQARDPRTVDVRSDIYSLGCTFFFMLTGRPPFPEGTVLQKLLQHQGDSPPDVRHFRPDLPEDASQVLRRMLAKDPRRRYQTPLELVDDLVGLAERVGLRPLGPGRRVWVRPPESKWSSVQRHLPWLAPVAALLCIVVLLDIMWSSSAERSAQAPPPLIGGPEEFVSELPDPPDYAASRPPGSAESGSPSATAGRPPAATAPAGADAPSSDSAGENSDLNVPGETSPNSEASMAEQAAGGESPDPLAETVASEQAAPAGTESEPGAEGSRARAETAAGATPAMSEDEPPPEQAPPELAEAEGADWSKPVGRRDRMRAASLNTPQRSGVLVVDGTGEAEGAFSSLGAACAAAQSGDVIELRFNGLREERPVALANVKLTIRPGNGFRPVLVFRPDDPDPVTYPRSMLSATGGRLTLVHVAMRLEIPRELAAQQWSLLEVGQTQTVRLEQCTMSVCNSAEQGEPYGTEVAFFRTRSDMPRDIAVGDDARALAGGPQIELYDCVARGQATFLRAYGTDPLSFLWQNGLLVTGERLLWLEGDQQTPRPDDLIRLKLEHLTAVVHKGLCRMRVDPMIPDQLPLEIQCANSILIGNAEGPLLEQLGTPPGAALQSLVRWNGERNFYQGFAVFWRTATATGETAVEQLGFDDWQALWGPDRETLPSWGQVQWHGLPGPEQTLCERQPSDYRLADNGIDNPALGAASDGANAGAQLDRLPRFPEAAASTSSGDGSQSLEPQAGPAADSTDSTGPAADRRSP